MATMSCAISSSLAITHGKMQVQLKNKNDREFQSALCPKLWSSFSGKCLKFERVVPSASKSGLIVENSAEFGAQEAAKFKEDFLEILKANNGEIENPDRVEKLCAEAIRNYAAKYDGSFSVEQFADLRKQLEKEGLPTVQPLLAVVGWARTNLYYDWKKNSK